MINPIQTIYSVDEKSKRAASLDASGVDALSDEEVSSLAMPRPGHPEQRGFMFDLKDFKSDKHMAEVLSALMKRLTTIQASDKTKKGVDEGFIDGNKEPEAPKGFVM